MSKEIKFRKTIDRSLLGFRYRWTGRKNGNTFTVSPAHGRGYYVMVDNKKKDYVFNSLWREISFESPQSAFEWCNEFDPSKFEIDKKGGKP